MEPTARHGPGQTVKPLSMGRAMVDESQFQVIVPKGRRKVDADKVVRLTVVVSRGRDATFRRLADERFAGNMSAAASWAIGLAAVVLDGPLKGLQVPTNPADALPTATERRP